MIKIVFFDLDGTLIDQKTAQNTACKILYSKYGFDSVTDVKTFIKKWDELTVYHYDAYLRRECSYEEQRKRRIEDIFSYFNVSYLPDNPLAVYDVYLKLFEESWVLYPDVLPCLKDLKARRYRMGVITNGEQDQQTLKLSNTGILDYFDDVVAAGEYDCPKPDCELFRIACRRSQVAIDECVYIGDSYKSDIIPCKELGMKCIFLNRKNAPLKDDDVISVSTCDRVSDIIDSFQ